MQKIEKKMETKPKSVTIPIYSVTKKGKTSLFFIEIYENEDGSATLIRYNGLVGGKLRSQSKTITKGKNLGKANETSPFEQAKKEAESYQNKKLDEGYKTAEYYYDKVDLNADIFKGLVSHKLVDKIIQVLNIKHNTDANDRYKPMLAEKFKGKIKEKVKYPVFVQRKYNGMRCIAFFENGEVKLRSREGKLFDFPVVQQQIEKVELIMLNLKAGRELDGELYCHGMPLQDIIHNIRTPNAFSESIVYHIYDFMIEDTSFKVRLTHLDGFNRVITDKELKNITIAPTWTASNEDEVKSLFTEARENKYEGVMVRSANGNYDFSFRSRNLLKVKETISAEFKIVGTSLKHASDTKDFVWVCVTNSNKQFEVKPHGTDDERREQYENRNTFIGKYLQLDFFEYTNDKVPFHITSVTVRDYE